MFDNGTFRGFQQTTSARKWSHICSLFEVAVND